MPAGELLTVSEAGPVAVTVSVKVGEKEKLALTETGDVPTENVQDPVPEQGPLQPAKEDVLVSGAAVRVTGSPELSEVLVQTPDVAPATMLQLIAPVPVTAPVPAPAPVTVTVVGLKVAVTACAAVMLTTQAAVPVQAPPHPAKAVPAGAVGVSVTGVP